jgi:AcrR family transcriptional regulator
VTRCARPSVRDDGPFFASFIDGRRGEILDAALAVFAEKGFDGGTMREIAGRLDLTEPALYRHYAGKEALFADLIAAAGDHLVSKLGPALAGLEPESLYASLSAVVEMRRVHLSRTDGVKPMMRTLFTSAPHNPIFRAAFREHLGLPMIAALEGFVPRVDAYYGIDRTPEDVHAKVRVFVSLFVGFFMTGMMLDLPEEDAATVESMFAIMDWPTA